MLQDSNNASEENLRAKDHSACSLSATRYQIQLRFLALHGHISANIANTLRGGFGAALHDIVCTFSNIACKECPISEQCAYGYIFETPIPSHTTIMRKYPYAPHPLIILPMQTNLASVAARKSTGIVFTLIGKSQVYFPYILLTMKEFGTRGIGPSRIPFQIESIVDENERLLYSSQDEVLRNVPQAQTFSIAAGQPEFGVFSLNFDTPLRLQVNGSITRSPSFKDIIASLSRRVTLLSYFHCSGNGEPLGRSFLERVHDVELIESESHHIKKQRFSARQKQKIPMDGYMGTLTFRGDYGSFLPLLKAGEYIHIGKDTVFGYGHYHMEVKI